MVYLVLLHDMLQNKIVNEINNWNLPGDAHLIVSNLNRRPFIVNNSCSVKGYTMPIYKLSSSMNNYILESYMRAFLMKVVARRDSRFA